MARTGDGARPQPRLGRPPGKAGQCQPLRQARSGLPAASGRAPEVSARAVSSPEGKRGEQQPLPRCH